MEKFKQIRIEWVGIIGLVLILVGILYPRIASNNYRLETIANTFQIEYMNKNGVLQLNSINAISDIDGMNQEGIKVNITNMRDTEAMYLLRLQPHQNNTIDLKNLKISYNKNNEGFIPAQYISNLGNDFIILDNQKLGDNTTDTYEFVIWVSDTSVDNLKGKRFSASLLLEKIEITEEEAKDKTPPTIILNEPLDIEVNQNEVFTDPGIASIIDDIDGVISNDKVAIRYEYRNDSNVKAVAGVNTAIPGVYYIYYSVKDKANNESSVIRIVTVKSVDNSNPDEISPILPDFIVSVSYSTTEVTKEDVIVTIKSNVTLKPLTSWQLSSDGYSLSRRYSTNVDSKVVVVSTTNQSAIASIVIKNIDKTDSGKPTPSPPPTPTPGIITVRMSFGQITTSSVELNALSSNASEVKEYYYNCGNTWSSATKEQNYICSNLESGKSYTFQVKTIDKQGRESLSSKMTTKTFSLIMPTFSVIPSASAWTNERKVTINYEKEASNVINQYRYSSNENWITVDSQSVTLTLTAKDTILARTTDGAKELVSSYIETKIDTESPIISNKSISISNIALNHVTLTWTKATDNSTASTDLTYYVCKSTENNLNSTNCKGENKITSANNIDTYQVTNLKESTTYYFGVIVVDRFGHEAFYDVKQQVTATPTIVPTPTPTIVPTPTPVQIPRFDIANKSDLVAINYSTWHYYMQTKNNNAIYRSDLGTYGPIGAFHYWSMPALGYYSSLDKNVIRKHMTQLVEAGVDFIIIDNTNVIPAMFNGNFLDTSSAYYQLVSAPMKALLDTMVEMRKEGLKTPYVVPWQRTDEGQTMLNVFNNIFIRLDYDLQGLKDAGYDKEKWQNLWVYWNNKPFILTTTLTTPDMNCEYRKMWGLQPSVSRGEWSYLQRDNRNNKGTNFSGTIEQMSVSTAIQQTRMSNTSTALGRRNGLTFYQQWYNAFNARPKIITLTWWNEWGAERISSSEAACSTYCFTDNYNQEYSRDIEPMNGGHKDTYYNWMKQYISAYKNHQSCPRLVN